MRRFSDRPVQVPNVGDVMQDSALFFAQKVTAPQDFGLSDRFILTTLHRAEDTYDSATLKTIISALRTIPLECCSIDFLIALAQ